MRRGKQSSTVTGFYTTTQEHEVQSLWQFVWEGKTTAARFRLSKVSLML